MSEPPRRFAPPWTVDEPTEGFCIRDAILTNPQLRNYQVKTGVKHN